MNIIFILYLFSAVLFAWNGKLEVIIFYLILCTVVLMQITGIYFYFVSLYTLLEINQPYLFNLSLEKSFYLLSHSNRLPLESLLYSDMSFQSWKSRMIFQRREIYWFMWWNYIFCCFLHPVPYASLHFVYLF